MKEMKKISLLLLTAMLALAFNVQPVAAVDWWPMFHHDPNHTGYSTSTAPDTNNVSWSHTIGDLLSSGSSPAVADGNVYVGLGDHKVYCLNASTGAFIWSYTTGNAVRSSPAVADGNVYVGSGDHKVYCLNASTGEFIWSYTTGHWVESSPAVADGKVYVGSNDYKVYCLNASTGAFIWSYTTGNIVDSSPAVTDGKVFVGSHDGKVYCLNASTGAFIWSYTTGDYITHSSPAVADGKVYVGSWDQNVYCLNASTGAFIWSCPIGNAVWSSPAVADGNVYVLAYREVYCLDAEGNGDGTTNVIWSYTTGNIVFSSPAVAGGKVYAGSRDHNVYCLNASTGAFIWSYTTGGDVDCSPAVADDKVYVESAGKVYAFGLALLNLLSPNGGECLLAGTSCSIEWENVKVMNDVLIEYSTDNGDNWTAITSIAPDSGSYEWLVPDVSSNRCLVHISDADNPNVVFDASDAVFIIYECRLTADLTDDCYVGWTDLGIFAGRWLASGCCEPNWCDGADLDQSQDVNFVDFSIFASQWPECGNCCDPACGPRCWCCPTQCHGDADCDGVINITDVSILVAAWGSHYPELKYDPCADFNRDGAVDYHDQQILEEYWWYLPLPADCPTEP